MGSKIKYRERTYKYQLVEGAYVQTSITGYNVNERLFRLTPDGILYACEGYAWDGPSGPTWDTPDFMRGSLFHDVLYQMIREGFIPPDFKTEADALLRQLCIEDGMSEFRAHYVFEGVARFGASSCEPGSDESEIKTAP